MVSSEATIKLLLQAGLINEEKLSKAGEEAKRTGLSIERALQKLGFVSEEDIVKVRADALGLPFMDLENCQVDIQLVS